MIYIVIIDSKLLMMVELELFLPSFGTQERFWKIFSSISFKEEIVLGVMSEYVQIFVDLKKESFDCESFSFN